MATTTLERVLPADEFSPITLNGEPVVTWRTVTLIEIGERLYESEYAASEDCSCRRCMLHDDFGGCIVADRQWGLVLWLSAPLSTGKCRF